MRVLVTGASGHLGAAVVPELIRAGHDVVGLARSDSAAARISAYGAGVRRGELDDLDGLAAAAADSDGVIHLAFKHEQMNAGDFASALSSDVAAVQAIGAALDGTGKAFVGTSGTLGLTSLLLDRNGTEEDVVAAGPRADAEMAVIAFANSGVRSSVIRIPPVTHSTLDRAGFVPTLIAIARAKGFAGYAGDGTNRWPAVHTLDAASLYRLALEQAPAGSRLHAVSEEGIPVREIAQHIGDHLGLPTASVPADQLQDYFGSLERLISLDNPTSSATTRRTLLWEPTNVGLLEDFETGEYFEAPSCNSAP